MYDIVFATKKIYNIKLLALNCVRITFPKISEDFVSCTISIVLCLGHGT